MLTKIYNMKNISHNMTINDIIKKRYAAKSFSGESITEEQLIKLKESIRLAPSSFNWQPWKIKVINDKEVLKKLQEASWNQPQVGSASHLFVFCAMDSLVENNTKLQKNMKENLPKEKFEMYSKMINDALSYMTPEAQKRMSERELFMPVQNLLLCATDLGLAACPMGGFTADKYKEILDLPKNLTPIVVVPVGIANDEAHPKFRFSDSEIFF